jgi:hypothetical protein
MSKKLDPDIKALKMCQRALETIGTKRMLAANVEFLYDRYVRNPPRREVKR